MPTPYWLTGFEYGSTPNQNGGGLVTSYNGTPTCVTNKVNSGTYALKIVTDGVTQQNLAMNLAASQQSSTARVYILLEANPNSNWGVVFWRTGTSSTNIGMQITPAGVLQAFYNTGGTQNFGTLTLNQWYCIDMKLIITGTTWTLDWSVNTVAQTQLTLGGQSAADSIASFRLGSSSTTINNGIMYFDDVVLCQNTTDYPIGYGGTMILIPSADGTHSAGTNIMEDNAGTDIGVTTAWDKIDTIPMSTSTTYIRQFAIGTANYAEVLFSDLKFQNINILGVSALLAYTSATTTSNNGGCIISKDSFSTQTTLWGASGALSDYSDGSTAALWYKRVTITGLTVAQVNSFKARFGYAGDATPNPYWVNLAIEVAYGYNISSKFSNQAVNRAASF